MCVEVSKSLTEALCKTILINQNTTYKDDISFNGLVKQTLEHLIEQTGKEIVGLSELCCRISTVAQSIAEIRNNAGFASHGLDVLHPQIDKITIPTDIQNNRCTLWVHFTFLFQLCPPR